MRRVLVSAGRILVVGIALGVGVGVVRGVPATEDPAADEGACLPPVADAPVVSWVDVETAAELHDGPGSVFVDARSEEAFLRGHVSAALHVPMEAGVVADDIVELLRGYRTVVTYDDTSDDCARSTRLASVLVQSGLADVRVLEGGFPAWLDADYPAEAGTCRLCP